MNKSHGSSWATYHSLPGWNVDFDAAPAPIELQFGGTGGIQAQDGNSKMELDSHNEGKRDGVKYTASNSHVYQDIPTAEGEELTLSFWYSPRTTTSTNDVAVVWNGVQIAVLTGDTPGWQEFTFEVEGADGSTRLEFQGLPSENTLGGYIDNVYVGDRDFDYTLSDGDETDTAHVDVQYQVGNQLLGGDENEILISGEDGDTLMGGEGDDTLIGGEGDDVLIGGEGEDEFFFSDAATDGDDEIEDFVEGEDTINLDALFDELGIANADRAGDVNLTADGNNTVITIDGETDFSITVRDVDLGETTGGLTAEELAAKGIIISDES
ncbi:M10 family metallopeptidase C-terminal domain-containing protein [Sneathiella glossodoripedis]|uniref:M10 family metallopeptidase C-terminal domain-containing protein n=1 Tax=Sneathiella glossodoripedis TaxID=418853 RepID=UPI00046F2E18|nr:M10 family metallopeptidase C-terminal domain-containing protein [Sneathiella glossodoripedis]